MLALDRRDFADVAEAIVDAAGGTVVVGDVGALAMVVVVAVAAWTVALGSAASVGFGVRPT